MSLDSGCGASISSKTSSRNQQMDVRLVWGNKESESKRSEGVSPRISVADVIIVGTVEQPAQRLVDELIRLQSSKRCDKELNIIYKDKEEFLGISYPVVKHPSSSTIYVCLDQDAPIQESLQPFERHFSVANQFMNGNTIRPIKLTQGTPLAKSQEVTPDNEGEVIHINLDAEKDIEAAFLTMLAQGMYHGCPNALAQLDRKETCFVDGAIFQPSILPNLIGGHHVVQVNVTPKHVLHLQPKSFDSILLVPLVYRDTYVKYAAEISKTSESNVQAVLSEGLICSRSLLKTMKEKLYGGRALFAEETCLVYFLRNGIIISTPVPKFVKKSWGQRVSWFYNPFTIAKDSLPQEMPKIHPEAKVQTMRLVSQTDMPADFFGIVCLVLHEFCTPNSVYIGGQLAWGSCCDVTVVIQRTPTVVKGRSLLFDLDETKENAIYVSVLNSRSSENAVWIMSRAIQESLQASIANWNGLDFQIEMMDSCLTTVAGGSAEWKSHQPNCSNCDKDVEAQLRSIKKENDDQQKRRKLDAKASKKPPLCSDGNFGNPETETETLPPSTLVPKQLVRRKTSGYGSMGSHGYGSMGSDASMMSTDRTERTRRQMSFEVYEMPHEAKRIDTRMSFKDMQQKTWRRSSWT